MKSLLSILALVFVTSSLKSQVNISFQHPVFGAKEQNKDIALFHARDYVVKHLLNEQDISTRFELFDMAAAGSGELISLYFRCATQNKEGLILSFWNEFINDYGVRTQGYSFKFLPMSEATSFLELVYDNLNTNREYLKEQTNFNNLTFKYKDITIVFFDEGRKLRVYWANFNSSWEQTSFLRTRHNLNFISSKYK